MKKSLHILADLYDCRGEQKYFIEKSAVRDRILRTVKKAGFQIVASRFHKFGDGGITGVIIVSESHITIHTWPEKTFVNVDVFFCNYTSDNSKKARAVFNYFKRLYKPKRTNRKEVWRD
ncbi:adenosylmethionine decarboxylase [Patescibacteria group bacterium]|nr:adenosylmethionine decarboxylase [Patescibacteria group bacterium]